MKLEKMTLEGIYGLEAKYSPLIGSRGKFFQSKEEQIVPKVTSDISVQEKDFFDVVLKTSRRKVRIYSTGQITYPKRIAVGGGQRIGIMKNGKGFLPFEIADLKILKRDTNGFLVSVYGINNILPDCELDDISIEKLNNSIGKSFKVEILNFPRHHHAAYHSGKWGFSMNYRTRANRRKKYPKCLR